MNNTDWWIINNTQQIVDFIEDKSIAIPKKIKKVKAEVIIINCDKFGRVSFYHNCKNCTYLSECDNIEANKERINNIK